MRKLLLSISVVAVAFGFAASGAQAESSNKLTILKSTLVLPSDQSVKTCIVSARRDALIHAFFTDNTPTDGVGTGFNVLALRLAGSAFMEGNATYDNIGGNRVEALDMIRVIAFFGSNETRFGPIPLAKGEKFEVDFNTDEANAVTIDVKFAVESSKTPKLKSDCAEIKENDDDD